MNLDASPQGHIGRYRIIDRIAVGGMAEVLVAVDELGSGAQRRVVVKKLLPHLAEDREFVKMFAQEARIASGISHPNVVRIHKLGEQNGFPYIVMEFVPGQTFRQLIREVKRRGTEFPVGVALQLGIQAAAGAHSAHEYVNPFGSRQEVVHRDLSPHNLMVNCEGIVKVLDFGIAKATQSSDATKTGVLKGKIGYLSPEQVLQRGVDRRSDIFTLCVVIWELIAGERLFVGDNDLSIMQSISQGEIRPLMDARSDVPRNLVQVIEKGLMVDPTLRYDTAAELASALKRAAHESNIMLSPRETALFINAMVGDSVMKQEKLLNQAVNRERELGQSIAHLDEETEIPNTAPTMVRHQISPTYVTETPVLTKSNSDTPTARSEAPPTGPSPHVFTAFIGLIVLALIVLGWFKIQSEQIQATTTTERPTTTEPTPNE